MAVLPVRVDGSLAPVVQAELHQVSKVYSRRVSGHVRSVVSPPDDQYLLAPDPGVNKIPVYRYAPEQAECPLQAINPAFTPVLPGSGPRHLIFSTDERFAHLTLELSDQVIVFVHKGNGHLCQSQTRDLAPAGFQGEVGTGALHLSADGRFLGVLNHGDDNQLVTFTVDPASGRLRFVERRSMEGTELREFAFSPSGRFVPAANQNSDQSRMFARDPQSGQVGKTLRSVEVGSPSDLRFMAVP